MAAKRQKPGEKARVSDPISMDDQDGESLGHRMLLLQRSEWLQADRSFVVWL